MARPTLTWALLLAALVPLAAAESRSLKFKPYASTPGGCRKKEGLHDIYWNMMAADRDEFAKVSALPRLLYVCYECRS